MNNGATFTKAIAALATSAIVATAAMLWSLSGRLSALEERTSILILRSDRNDINLEHQLQDIEKQLSRMQK